MLNTNGYGPKRAILYARVSTQEQATKDYSLAQQIEALREHADVEEYEILEEVVDPGQSGASIARPGMDRVRDLVASSDVSVVLAQDWDRLAREPAYIYLLEQEFDKYGCKLKALNDSLEGELTDGILDQLAKFEQAKIAERTRRGKLRKAKEGKIIATKKPPYGFHYADDSLVIHEPEIAVVERIFRLAAEDKSSRAIQGCLHVEGIPSPTGGEYWPRTVLKRLVLNALYKPHTYEEMIEIGPAEVATTLKPGQEYGIRWWNLSSQKSKQVSEPNSNGQRRYQKQYSYVLRDREEWMAVPAPATCPVLWWIRPAL